MMLPVQKVPAHENDISMHENDISMHENDISMHENFAPGMIYSSQKCPWVIELYTTSCMEFSPMKICRQNFHFHARKIYFHAITFHSHT